MPPRKGLIWTEKQRQVAELLAQGQTYAQLVKAGYNDTLITRVRKALKEGQGDKIGISLPANLAENIAPIKDTAVAVPPVPPQPEQPKEDEEDDHETPESKDKLVGSVAGDSLRATVNISVKTLALYQIAASQQSDSLTLGDFIDTCVEDFFRVRGKDLGLIQFGGR